MTSGDELPRGQNSLEIPADCGQTSGGQLLTPSSLRSWPYRRHAGRGVRGVTASSERPTAPNGRRGRLVCCIVCCLPGGGAGSLPIPRPRTPGAPIPSPSDTERLPTPALLPPHLPPALLPSGPRELAGDAGASRQLPGPAGRARTAARSSPSFQRGACLSRKAHLAPGGAHRPLPVPWRGKSTEIREETPQSWPLWTRGPRGAPGQRRSLLAKALRLGPALQKGDAFTPGLLAQPDSPQLRRTGAGESIATADECSHPSPSVTCLQRRGSLHLGGLLFRPHCAAQSSLWLTGSALRLPCSSGC